MSNPTLKEQLLALSLGTASPNDPSEKKQKEYKEHKTHKEYKEYKEHKEHKSHLAAKKKPVWLEHAQYGVELLKAHYPNCFKEMKDTKPLKIGIKQDLVKYLSTKEEIVIGDKACMVNSLAYYVGSSAYHKSMVEGATRIDLDGHAAGTVTKEEATYSQDCLQTKFKKRDDKSKRE